MFRKIRYCVPVLLLGLCLPCLAGNVESGIAQLSVNVYNDAKVPPSALHRAEQSASKILHTAGLQIEWRNSEDDSQKAGTKDCGNPRFNVLSIRLVAHSLTQADSLFGASFLDQDGKGLYGDVFYENARRLSDTAHVSVGDVLGHVIAHELGHLLLGKNAHSPTGIMRPHWSKQELVQLAMGRLLFSAEQGQLMTKRLGQGTTPSQSNDPNLAAMSRLALGLHPKLPEQE